MRLSDIDLRLLRVFIAVAEAGGFAKAQETLGISQPAISSQIAKLENRLNLRLCHRGPQGFALTEPGGQVLFEAQSLIAHVDASAAKLLQIGRTRDTELRLGVMDCMITDAANPVVPALRAFRSKRPDADIKVGIYDLLDCMTELRAGRIDIAIAGIAADEAIPSDLEAMALYDEESGLFCAPDHPCASQEDPAALQRALADSAISAYNFTKNPIGQELDVDLMDQQADIPQDAVEATVYLALGGSHVGLMPLHFAQRWTRSGELVQLSGPDYKVISRFHALRQKTSHIAAHCHEMWTALLAHS